MRGGLVVVVGVLVQLASQNVDKIFVVKEGEIIEEGSHSQLIESNGVYADMWKEFNESVEWKVKNTSDEKNGDNND